MALGRLQVIGGASELVECLWGQVLARAGDVGVKKAASAHLPRASGEVRRALNRCLRKSVKQLGFFAHLFPASVREVTVSIMQMRMSRP